VFLAYLPLDFASPSVVSRIEDSLQRVTGSTSTDHGTARDRDVNISALGVNELIYAATRDAFFLPYASYVVKSEDDPRALFYWFVNNPSPAQDRKLAQEGNEFARKRNRARFFYAGRQRHPCPHPKPAQPSPAPSQRQVSLDGV
jgi:hypothetical protein